MAKKFLVEGKKSVKIEKIDNTFKKTAEYKRNNGDIVTTVRQKGPDGDTFRSRKVDKNPKDSSVNVAPDSSVNVVPDSSVNVAPDSSILNSATRIDSSITGPSDAQHNLSNDGYNNRANNPDNPLKVGPQNSTSNNNIENREQTGPTKPTNKTNVENTEVDDSGVNDVTNQDDTVPGGAFEWFANNWKTVAIVAGAAAIIAGIVALVKGMNKTIKVRYNKVVRTLQRAQKDFTLEDRGLDMRAVMPGIGSKIFDKIAGWWNKGAKKSSANGNIGIHPFCNQYKEEIGSDLRQAQEAFSKIKLAADEMEQGLDAEQNANQSQNSSVETKVYDSFQEALNSDVLNESEQLNEIGAMAAISMAMSLGGLAVRAGKFVISKFKNGKPDGEGKVVQVTKQSTREICMAIINNYGNKYINMQAVYEQLGINTQSLADIDKSSCDKLGQIIKKYQKPEANKITTKQYSRIQKAYENMLKHYYNIGDGIIKNFAKYTNADNEKDENLLVSAKEKLQNMWDSQKDFYDNNFSRIVVEIVGSYSAIAYNDFIVEKVIPVFKSGIAGDADYILDAVPKKGEYYILRQTEGQPWMENGEVEKGNTAIAEITGYDKDKKEISFKLIARMENDGNINIDDRGIASVEGDVNYDFYTDGDGNVEEQKLAYGKWLALDPALTEWRPVADRTKVYTYTTEQGYTYVVYATKDIRSKEEGYDTVYVGLLSKGMVSISKLVKISLKVNITKQGFASIFEKLDVKFEGNSNNKGIKKIVTGIESFRGEITTVEAESVEGIVEVIVEIVNGESSEGSVENYLEYIKENSKEFAQKIIDETAKLEGKMTQYGEIQYKKTSVLITKKPVPINLGIKTKNGEKVIVYFSIAYDKNKNGNDSHRYFIGFKEEYDAYAGYFPMGDLKQVEIALIKICDAGMNNNPLSDVDEFAGNTMSGEVELTNFFNLFKSLLSLNNENGNNVLVVKEDQSGKVDVTKRNDNYYVVTSKTLKIAKDNQTQQLFIYVSPLNQDGTFNISTQIGNTKEMSAPIKPNDNNLLNNELNKFVKTIKDNGYGVLPVEQNSSIEVSYSHKVVNESITTNTLVTRTFKNFPRKSYVLSESYFDLGRDTSRLSNPVVAKRFKTKANVYEYVKNNLDAKIYQLTESQTYTICSYTHNKPSLMTPLYENVYVVRFDNDDNVSSIKYLGKFKIQ